MGPFVWRMTMFSYNPVLFKKFPRKIPDSTHLIPSFLFWDGGHRNTSCWEESGQYSRKRKQQFHAEAAICTHFHSVFAFLIESRESMSCIWIPLLSIPLLLIISRDHFWCVKSIILLVLWILFGWIEQGGTESWECEMDSVLLLSVAASICCVCVFWEILLGFFCWLFQVSVVIVRTCNSSLSWCLHESSIGAWCWICRAIWPGSIGSTLLWTIFYHSGWIGTFFRWIVPSSSFSHYWYYHWFY